MSLSIAVFLGGNGQPTSLYEEGKIVVYSRNMGHWLVSREKEFTLKTIKNMGELRRRMEEALEFLQDCTIFVGYSLTGIPYYLLEKARFSTWECKGTPEDFLDYILEKEELNKKKPSARKGKVTKSIFKEITHGVYQVSLKEIQEKSSTLSSRQALLPFLSKGGFTSLEILCNHIPLWLEGEVLAGKYKMENLVSQAQEVKLLITKP